MFNPFYLFTLPLLQAFEQKGKRYFVRQTFPRGLHNEELKGAFLISAYDHQTTALDHYGALSHDKYRHFYDLQNAEDRVRLVKAANGLQDYRIFSPLLRPDWEKCITDTMRQQIRKYIANLGWTPKGNDVVDTAYEVRFGELFLCLKYKKREVAVKLEEVEMLRGMR